MTILDVNETNVDELGFFCYMSKRKSEGYKRKLAWVKERFKEGLRIKMLQLPDRGFIEYIPGEYAWRAINADGYMVIHCLWVVGKSKKQGYARALLQACVDDAKASGMKGVAMVTSEGNWLMSKKFLVKQGWETADTSPPFFTLLVKRFEDAPLPSFLGNWEEKAKMFGDDVTILRTDQCPYIVDAVDLAAKVTEDQGIPCKIEELSSSTELKEKSPSPFGVFGIVMDGCLLSYHYLLEKDLKPLLEARER